MGIYCDYKVEKGHGDYVANCTQCHIPHTLILHTNSGDSDLVSTSFGIDVTQHWW